MSDYKSCAEVTISKAGDSIVGLLLLSNINP